jgi:iron complex transport system substrate-binding protein
MRTNKKKLAGILSAPCNVNSVIGYVLLFFTVFSLSGCHKQTDNEGKIIPLRYASFLKMRQTSEYVSVQIINPWDTTKSLRNYILIPKNIQLPRHLPEGTIVRTPLTHTIIYSSVHCSLLGEWGKINSIAGICDMKYIMMKSVHQLNNQGKIVDLGNSMSPDAEKIIALNPDAILLSPYKDNSGYGKLGNSGIPLIECADYMETSPLGRAEWMKFYGLLYGCEDKANRMFNIIEKKYMYFSQKALKSPTRPTVFADMKNGATWMIPGGNSTIGIFLKDAGANYEFKDRKESGSVTISPEEVLNRCQKAQFWLIKYNNGEALNYQSLKSLDPIYNHLEAVKKRHVYACNTGIIPFYEETPFHPERLLMDLIKIFHPELIKDYKSKYYIAL